jgi:hypothetical protein
MGRRKFWLGLTWSMNRRVRQQGKTLLGDPLSIASPHQKNCTNAHSTPSNEPMDITQGDVTVTTNENLSWVMILPSQWIQHTQELLATIQVCKISSMAASSSSTSQPIVTHSLTVNNYFTWAAFCTWSPCGWQEITSVGKIFGEARFTITWCPHHAAR